MAESNEERNTMGTEKDSKTNNRKNARVNRTRNNNKTNKDFEGAMTEI